MRSLGVKQNQLEGKVAESHHTLADVQLEITNSRTTLDAVKSEISDARQQFVGDEDRRRVVQEEEVASQVSERVRVLREKDATKKGEILEDVSPLDFWARVC